VIGGALYYVLLMVAPEHAVEHGDAAADEASEMAAQTEAAELAARTEAVIG
jgi:hypothetical protein